MSRQPMYISPNGCSALQRGCSVGDLPVTTAPNQPLVLDGPKRLAVFSARLAKSGPCARRLAGADYDEGDDPLLRTDAT